MYAPGPNAPDPGDVHWIQSVHDNDPSFGGTSVGGGFFDQIDNDEGKTDPTYDGNGGAADSTCFVDVPADMCSADCNNAYSFTFTTFVSTWDAKTKSITIFDQGVTWGYDFTCTPTSAPEPGAFAALGVGLVGLVWRRRRPSKVSGQNN
jgi:hypothetical protein